MEAMSVRTIKRNKKFLLEEKNMIIPNTVRNYETSMLTRNDCIETESEHPAWTQSSISKVDNRHSHFRSSLTHFIDQGQNKEGTEVMIPSVTYIGKIKTKMQLPLISLNSKMGKFNKIKPVLQNTSPDTVSIRSKVK